MARRRTGRARGWKRARHNKRSPLQKQRDRGRKYSERGYDV